GADVGRGQKLRELAHIALDFRGGSVDGDFDGRGRDAGPVLKFRLIEIDAAVFAGAGLEHAGGSQFDRPTLESEFEGLAVGADYRSGACADEGLAWLVRPMAHLPPVVQFAGAGKVGADDDYRLPVFGASDSIRKRNSQHFCGEGRFYF